MKSILTSLVLLGLLTTPVLAQSSAQYDQQVLAYDNQINQYRILYQEYLATQQQFESIDSFANQEAYLEAAQEMLVARAEVWLAYWQAMQIQLAETPGTDTGMINQLQTRITEQEEEVEDHIIRLKAMDNLEDLDREAQWLNRLDGEYESLAFEALLTFRMGRYNWALIQLEEYVDRLDKNIYVQIREPELQEIRLRGLVEVKEALEENRETYEAVRADLLDSERNNRESLYEDFIEEITESYAQLGRIMNLIVELSQGTVL